ncbi:MAG: alpha/beta hydrolase, partial [Ruthenibacterium sp.]
MKAKLHSAKFWVCIALTLCLISMIGASLIQTSGNKITIKEMSWESPSGHQLSAYLFKPPTASKDAPAPAVVTIEGWYNNKEMQDLYSIELARRGYVVLALDMHSHGNSESLAAAELYDGAVGVDGAVQLVADLPYVDAARIGVTGHSSGGTAANMAVAIDNEREVPLIKSVLQQAGDWQDDTGADHSGDY